MVRQWEMTQDAPIGQTATHTCEDYVTCTCLCHLYIHALLLRHTHFSVITATCTLHYRPCLEDFGVLGVRGFAHLLMPSMFSLNPFSFFLRISCNNPKRTTCNHKINWPPLGWITTTMATGSLDTLLLVGGQLLLGGVGGDSKHCGPAFKLGGWLGGACFSCWLAFVGWVGGWRLRMGCSG